MKKILVATNLLLLTVILFMACNNTPQKKATANDPVNNNHRPEVADPAPDDDSVSGLISDNLAVAMSEAYRNDHNKAYVTGTNEPDARSIWFSLAKLKSFIAKIEASTAGATTDLHLGIRMYYAKYPSLAEMEQKYPELLVFSKIAGKHTLFMTPTFNTGNGDIDFDFENVGNRNNPTPYTALLGTSRGHGTGNVFINLQRPKLVPPIPGQPTPRVENHGGLMPPPASGGTFPTGGEEQ